MKKERIVIKQILKLILLALLFVLTTATTYFFLVQSEQDDAGNAGSLAGTECESVRGTITEMKLLVSETDNNVTRFELVMNGSENSSEFPNHFAGVIYPGDIERIRIPNNASIPVEIRFQKNEDDTYILRSVKPLDAGTCEVRNLEMELWLHYKINEFIKDHPHNESSEIWTKGIDDQRKDLSFEM